MDYVEQLRRETQEAHAIFHQFALAVSTAEVTTLFFFYEGDEDPSFYMSHIGPRLAGRKFNTLICYGRNEVLKTFELVERDGRGEGRTLFFIDKDHTDIMAGAIPALHASIFQTRYYSIENYLACEAVFRRFWVERLHLSDLDQRYANFLGLMMALANQFARRNRVLMSLVLIGRGIDGVPAVKLNLNNVQLEKVFMIDIEAGTCRYRRGAFQHFLVASSIGLDNPAVSTQTVKSIIRRYLLSRNAKTFVRGKYELWFFWKVLALFARQLSDRAKARATGCKRATPSSSMGFDCAVESLAPLTPCPPDLNAFLSRMM